MRTIISTFNLLIGLILLFSIVNAESFNHSQSSLNLQIPWISHPAEGSDNILAHAVILGGHVSVTNDGKIDYNLISGSGGKGIIIEEYPDNGSKFKLSLKDRTNLKISHYLNNDPTLWNQKVDAFNEIDFGEIYENISLKLNAYNSNIEKIFYVDPGGNPGNIIMHIDNIDELKVNITGELELQSHSGLICFTKPVAYQIINGKTEFVEVAYSIKNKNEYGFALGEYNANEKLIIDPLIKSTFLGGSAEEGWEYSGAVDMTRDSEGNIFITGVTQSADFPWTSKAYDTVYHANKDIFISKFDADFSTLLASTFIGGANDDQFPTIAIDSNDNVFICGFSGSGYPTTPGAYDQSYHGQNDVVISKFDNNLSTLLASTYLGGSGDEFLTVIKIDSDGEIFVTGQTTSSYNFPTTIGAFQVSHGGSVDFFISKLNNDLSELLASTFVGGSRNEQWPNIGVNSDDQIILTGASESTNYPTTSDTYDATFNGPPTGDYVHDMIVSKFNNDLTSILASTYVGKSLFDGGGALALDNNDNIFIGGHTESIDYPITPGVFDESHNGSNEYFITKLNSALTDVLASTYLTDSIMDGSGFSFVVDMQCDTEGYLYLTGGVWDDFFITTSNAYDRLHNGGGGDAFIRKFDNDLTTLYYSSFIGGSENEGSFAIYPNNDGTALFAGKTQSPNFPIESSLTTYDNSYNGDGDFFMAEISFDQFSQVTDGPHVNDGGWSFGMSWIDYDNDEYPDLYINNDVFGSVGELNYLYHNNGDGTYLRVSEGEIANEGSSVASTWADYDNDGDIDGFVSNPGDLNYLYINDGDGTFTKATYGPLGTVDEWTMEAEWVDYDNDGLLDLFVVNHQPYAQPVTAALYHNEDGNFIRQDNSSIGLIEDECNSTAWGDYDNDGDRDLFWSRNEQLTLFFDNDGDGTFTENTGIIIAQLPRKYHGNWADYDNDGDLDLYTGSGYPGTPHIYENLGNGDLSLLTDQEIANDTGYWTGGYWGDYDNDGYQDLLVLGQSYYEPYPNRLYHNCGDGTFERILDGIIATDSAPSSAAAWADHDLDGDLDLFVTNVNYYNNSLYVNNGNANGWIQIALTGTNSNRSGIGAKIRLKANIAGEAKWQFQEVSAKTGFMSQDPLAAHFGLGDATLIDSIKIEWPSGMIDYYLNITPNQFITYVESICGDVDGNERINLLDITFLISYLYKGGSAPKNVLVADADGNGSVNILDVTFLIAYSYKGGPEPICN